MGSIAPTPDRMQRFLAATPDDAPVVMINLLRYRDEAAYAEGADAAPCTGREAYERYGIAVAPLLAAVGGRPIWRGEAHAAVIAPEGEHWDEAILVEYPSRKAFLEMASSPAYQAIAHHRTAALEDSRLIATATRATQLPG